MQNHPVVNNASAFVTQHSQQQDHAPTRRGRAAGMNQQQAEPMSVFKGFKTNEAITISPPKPRGSYSQHSVLLGLGSGYCCGALSKNLVSRHKTRWFIKARAQFAPGCITGSPTQSSTETNTISGEGSLSLSLSLSVSISLPQL